MTLQLSFFLYLYLAFLLFWFIFSVIAVYHMFKFGFKNITTYLTVFLYITLAAFILIASFTYIAQVDWNQDFFQINNYRSADSVWR